VCVFYGLEPCGAAPIRRFQANEGGSVEKRTCGHGIDVGDGDCPRCDAEGQGRFEFEPVSGGPTCGHRRLRADCYWCGQWVAAGWGRLLRHVDRWRGGDGGGHDRGGAYEVHGLMGTRYGVHLGSGAISLAGPSEWQPPVRHLESLKVHVATRAVWGK